MGDVFSQIMVSCSKLLYRFLVPLFVHFCGAVGGGGGEGGNAISKSSQGSDGTSMFHSWLK